MSDKIEDPGVGAFSNAKAKRFITSNGAFNVKHINRKRTLNETYTFLIGLKWSHFLLLIFGALLFINLIFALIYVVIGVECILVKPSGFIEDLFNAFFFSVQTMTSVGYGLYSPTNILCGIISSLEALLGLMIFAFVTGLLYGRFSKPHSNIKFSDSLVLRKYKSTDTDAIMFRLMNRRKSLVVLPKIKVSLVLGREDEKGGVHNDFFNLELERKNITYLPTTWTLVHIIDDKSPLKQYSHSQLRRLQGELLILISYYDESYNEELHQVHSYLLNDLKIGYRFQKAFQFNNDGKLELDHSLVDKVLQEK